MGLGDNLIATGLARGAAARGKRIAFGTGGRTHWDKFSAEIFRGNPNIVRPGMEGRPGVEWINFRTGHRLYNTLDRAARRWVWNEAFRPIPGEMFFDERELAWAAGVGSGFVAIEPAVARLKSWTPNKQWAVDRYDAVARSLARSGREVVQFVHGGSSHHLPSARLIRTPSFRHALAALARAALYIGPEGGMHHGAAAVGIPGVVIFGGFIPPAVTGYEGHTNLTGGAVACGSLEPCEHCRAALEAITVGEVLAAARSHLRPALEVA